MAREGESPLLTLKTQGAEPGAEECGLPLRAESSLQVTAMKDTGTSVLQPQGGKSCYNHLSLEEVWKPQMSL